MPTKRSPTPLPSNLSQTIPMKIEAILELLRDEWRNGFSLVSARRAETSLRSLGAAVTTNHLGLALVNIESDLHRYLTSDANERPAQLPPLADALKVAKRSIAASELVTKEKRDVQPAKRIPVRSLDPGLPVNALPKVGAAVEKKLKNLGVETIDDVVHMLPRRHIDYSQSIKIASTLQIPPDQDVTVRGTVTEVSSYPGPPARVQIRIRDDTGYARVTWFNPWLAKKLVEGDEIAISGKPERGYGSLTFTSPDWERVGGVALSTGRLIPVYSTTQGLAQKSLRAITRAALDATASTIVDYLPESIVRDQRFMHLPLALEQLHFPDSPAHLESAKRRLSFDQFLLIQLGLVKIKQSRQSATGLPMHQDEVLAAAFLKGLPFHLTGAQEEALVEVLEDMAKPQPMTRLLQGDVGSGKTVIAAFAALVGFSNNVQTAVMAPTEILAEQHYRSFQEMYSSLPEQTRPSVALLTGSTPAKQRREIVREVETGSVNVVIGTHALIQDSVSFVNLGLFVVDEQHRFGVKQRAELAAKSTGFAPHMLAMTATPIPRSLNMILNGDLDVTILAERPPGRVAIETLRFGDSDRDNAYNLVRREVSLGRQVFVICPLVEESDTSDARAAVAEAARLQRDVFPDLRVETLHGRMSGKEKDRIMTAFRNRESDILVTTSVIEVGVDVPNATVMMIEGSERFGLAQLHQFRGRVGRGQQQSWCLLISDNASVEANARLQMMVDSDDGFALADKDLELRGPGDFVGTRQSGLPAMFTFGVGFDSRLLNAARLTAETILQSDPELQSDEFAPLLHRLLAFWHTSAPDLPFSGQYHQG